MAELLFQIHLNAVYCGGNVFVKDTMPNHNWTMIFTMIFTMESKIGMRELLFEIHLMQRVNLDHPRAGRNDSGNDD